MILGVIVQSVINYHVHSATARFLQLAFLYLLNNKAILGIFSTNVNNDKAGAYHFKVTTVLSLYVLLLLLVVQ